MGNNQCKTCRICTGAEFIEKLLYPVGEYKICGWCNNHLRNEGRLEVGYEKGIWGKETALYLHPNGTLEREKVITW